MRRHCLCLSDRLKTLDEMLNFNVCTATEEKSENHENVARMLKMMTSFSSLNVVFVGVLLFDGFRWIDGLQECSVSLWVSSLPAGQVGVGPRVNAFVFPPNASGAISRYSRRRPAGQWPHPEWALPILDDVAGLVIPVIGRHARRKI